MPMLLFFFTMIGFYITAFILAEDNFLVLCILVSVFGGMWVNTMFVMHGYPLWDKYGMGGHEVTVSDIVFSFIGTCIQIGIIVWFFASK